MCHTDLHCIKGEVPFPQPAVFGHEICGEVVRYGPLPADAAAARGGGAGTPAGATPHPLPAGTKVISPFIMPCGSCAFCHKGEEDTCETFFALNRLKGHLYDDSTRLFTAATGEEVAMYSFAGLAEYCVVPATAVFALPEALLAAGLYEESCILGCAFFTAFGAIRNAAGLAPRALPRPAANNGDHVGDGLATAIKKRRTEAGVVAAAAGTVAVAAEDDAPRADAEPPQSVCVIGCGGVGGCLLQLLKHLGCHPIIAVDVTDEALEQARTLGADHLIKSSSECDAVQRISELTGGKKVDLCFEVIGLKQTFEQAVMAVRDGGKACFIGISDVKTKAEVPITHVVRRRISLVGSYGARASVDMPDLLEIAAKGGVDLRGAITRRFTLEEAGEAYTLLQQRKIVGRAIVTFL